MQEPIKPEGVGRLGSGHELARGAEPWWDDRTKTGYHAISQGFLIGEVVRRITGTTIGQFFKSEVADVLGADFFIGLPESEEGRVSMVIPRRRKTSGVPLPTPLRCVRSPLPRRRDHAGPTMVARRGDSAANGHGNARSVATIQQIIANNGHANGHRFFSEKIGDMVFTPQVGVWTWCSR